MTNLLPELDVDVLIVGGGLSGLALADRLQAAGIKFGLIEARNRLGGRILRSVVPFGDKTGRFDLGPSWFWPGQERIAALANRLGLQIFQQHAKGTQVFEDRSGRVHLNQGFSSMAGSLRLAGGMAGLIDGLVANLPGKQLSFSSMVHRLAYDKRIEAFDANGQSLAKADRIVLALPPRVASNLVFEPELGDHLAHVMRSIPTWMAGHAKIVAVYETAFWRDDGYSGDVMSQCGPLVEIHDASDPASGLGALFGFVGVPAVVRADRSDELKTAAIEQLTRLFGKKAHQPLEVILKDWAIERETATVDDTQVLGHHPAYGLPIELRGLWDGRLTFGSTETANQFGGFLEGALEAAEAVFTQLERG